MPDDMLPAVPGVPKRKRSATGAANFEDYFSANQDVATRDANAQLAASRKQATDAQTGLNSAVGTFNAKAKDPIARPGSGGALKMPATNVGAGANTGTSIAKPPPAQGEGLEGYFGGDSDVPGPKRIGQRVDPGNRGAQTQNGQPAPAQPAVNGMPAGTLNGRAQASLLGAMGGQTYNGPESLEDVEGYGAARDAENAAQTNLNLLGSEAGLQTLAQQQNPTLTQGESAFDAALAGRAGGRDFEALRQQFHPDEDVKTAEKAAIEKGKSVKKDVNERAAKNLQASTDLTKRLDQEDEDKANAAAEAKARGDKEAMDAKSKEAKHKQFVDFVTANPQDVIREIGKNTDVAGGLLNAITGGDTVSDKVADYFEKGTPQASRKFSTAFSLMNASNPELAENVFNSMSEEDWAKFNSLSDADQRKWLEHRSQEVS